jgi:VanZ family protein
MPSSRRTPGLPFCDLHISGWALGALCLLTLVATLIAGLWPFHSPRNQVSWVANENALRFGEAGTVLSSKPFAFAGSDGPSCSLEIWFEPARTWTTGSILTFYGSSNPRPFSLQQDFTDLVLQLGPGSENHRTAPAQVRVDDVFRKKQAFLTVTSYGQSTSVYLDGQLVTRSPGFDLSLSNLAGQLILANSPFRGHNWRGQLRGLAIYGTELSREQVVQHYVDWTQKGEPVIGEAEQAVALYLFNEGEGRTVHNAIGSGFELDIPKRYLVVHQLLLETPAAEFHSEPNYVNNAIFNIAGFIPLGFCFGLYFTAVWRMKQAALLTVVLGATVSVVIELCQANLPTRYSGVTDIITNTIGAFVGVVLCRAIASGLARTPISKCRAWFYEPGANQ